MIGLSTTVFFLCFFFKFLWHLVPTVNSKYRVSRNHTKCDSGCPKIAELTMNGKIEGRLNTSSQHVLEDVMRGVDIVCQKAEQL